MKGTGICGPEEGGSDPGRRGSLTVAAGALSVAACVPSTLQRRGPLSATAAQRCGRRVQARNDASRNGMAAWGASGWPTGAEAGEVAATVGEQGRDAAGGVEFG